MRNSACLIVIWLFVLFPAMGLAQVPLEFAYSEAEKEDSISALSITPLEARKTDSLLKKVITRLEQDLRQTRDSCQCQIEATFVQGRWTPFSAEGILTAEADIGLKVRDVYSASFDMFSYDGPYELGYEDSSLIKYNLVQLATLSPIHAHGVNFPFHGTAMSPLTDYKKTRRCYTVTAFRIIDASGRSVYRMTFERKEPQQRFKAAHREYNAKSSINGTAFFDGETLQLTQFKGEAYLPSMFWDAHFRYQIDYEEKDEKPVLKQIRIAGERADMVITATVHNTTL